MELDTVLKQLKLESYQELFGLEWDFSEPYSEGTIRFLSGRSINENGNTTGLDHDCIRTLVRIGQKIRESPALSRLFVHCHYLLYTSKNSPPKIGRQFPEMIPVLGNDSPGFLFLLAMSGIPARKKYFSETGIPEDVAKDTFKDLAIWRQYFEKNMGFTGLTPRILDWEVRLLRKFFRLGRLQFTLKPFEGILRAYRNKQNGAVLALAVNGVRFNSEGQVDGVDGFHDAKGAWESVWLCDKEKVTGNPISPCGFARQKKVDLDLLQWEEVLVPGDLVLDTHIPEDGPMTIEACSESFQRSLEFYPKYFPDRPFKAWACHSWFLDIQYQKILPETSNIIKFQRELYLYPTDVSGEDSYWRIFGGNGIKNGIENVPRKTSLQKAVVEFLEKGGRLQAGGGFFLPREMPFGKMAYHTNDLLLP